MAPIVAITAAILFGVVVFFLLRWRRRQRAAPPSVERQGAETGYHYVPARPASPGRIPQVETVPGRRISFSLPAPYPEIRTRNQTSTRPAQSRNNKNDKAGHIEPFTLHLGSSSQQPPRPASREHPVSQPSRPSDLPPSQDVSNRGFLPTRDMVSPAETNWSSFYTSPATPEVRGGATRPWAVTVSASEGGSSITQSGTGAATYAESNEGDNSGKELPPVYH